MCEVERRFREGSLLASDINEWLSENSRKIHKKLESFWSVDVPFPKYEISDLGIAAAYYKEGKIFYDLKMMREDGPIFTGLGVSFDSYMKMLVAEENTHYIHYQVNPQIRTINYKNFIERFLDIGSVNAQIEGIGRLGLRYISRSSRIPAKTIMRKLEEIRLKEINERFNTVYLIESLRTKPVQDTFISEIARITTRLHSLAGNNVANFFEKEYKGRYPELLYLKIEPEERSRTSFEQILERVPVFKALISYLSIEIELQLEKT